MNQRTDVAVDDDTFLWRPGLNESDSYAPNELNQYGDVNGAPFSYDGNGNLTGDWVNTYVYDAESRLIEAATSGHQADYSYDPFGRRSEKVVDGAAVTRYVYAGDTVIAEYDGSNVLLARYVPGLGIDKPVLMDRGGFLYYHYDGTGSVVAMTDEFGLLAKTYAYGPFGESAEAGVFDNPFRFTGRRLDEETGLYYYRARYYDPVLGRFLQADPIGFAGGLNLYAYVGNDPVNLVDPHGLTSDVAGPGRNAPDGIFRDNDIILVAGRSNRGSRRGGNLFGDPLAPVREAQFAINLREISRLEPNNRELTYVRAPNSPISREAVESTNAELNAARGRMADRISNGHAFGKHASEFGFVNQAEFSRIARDAISSPYSQVRDLSGGRTAYYDARANTLVIVNPNIRDFGTMFRPRRGQTFVDELR